VLGVTANGDVVAWGHNEHGQCEVPTDLADVRQVTAGPYHSLALKADGTVIAWGRFISHDGSVPAFVPPDLGAVSKIGTSSNAVFAEVSTDCNGDAVPDIVELSTHDCNGNEIHDSCDAAVDRVEDCNANGIGDTCEKQLAVSLSSGQLTPIGFQINQTWIIEGTVRAASAVRLNIDAHGDFGGTQEYVRVRLGVGFDEIVLRGTNDCGTGEPTSTAMHVLSPEQFNAAISLDGALRVTMEPSIAVDPTGCGDGTWIKASLEYLGAKPSDCNANGLLDGCEISAGYSPDSNNNGVIDTCEDLAMPCPADFDQSGVVNGADLGILLSAWGVAAQPGVDLNSDGIISGADLGLLLSAWGSCG
jgi:hypothetical protein